MSSDLHPRIDLKIVGDWGNANFSTIAGLINAHMRWRSEPGSTFWIKAGTGFRDNIEAVASGEVDVGITTPVGITLEWARHGRHFFEGTPFAGLRSIGWLPHDDRMIFAVREDLGIESFDDIRRQRPVLNIASTTHTPECLITWVTDLVLRKHGIEPEDIVRWGGSWMEHDHPRKCLPAALDGRANAVFHEGIMVPQWHQLVETVPMRFLEPDPVVMHELERDYGFKPNALRQGRLRAPRDIASLDFSGWVVFVNDTMSEDVAYRITSVLVEERAELEGRFRQLPIERSPLTYPIDPHMMWRDAGAPLHPGAERYYREHGYMTAR